MLTSKLVRAYFHLEVRECSLRETPLGVRIFGLPPPSSGAQIELLQSLTLPHKTHISNIHVNMHASVNN